MANILHSDAPMRPRYPFALESTENGNGEATARPTRDQGRGSPLHALPIDPTGARPRDGVPACGGRDVSTRKGICGICPAGCWVEVGIEDGKLVSIEPDSGHPLGMICRRGRHAPEIVHSEHRLARPLRRKGPKGTHDFEPITWDEAYDEIVARLGKIKRESGSEAVAIYTGRGAFELSLCDMFQPKGVSVSSASNVLFPFGSPNTMGVGALC